MARTFVLLLALLFGAGCASELVLDRDGALAVVPLKTSYSGHITVEAMLDGHGPFEFALDTGASISVVFEKARAKAQIEPLQGVRVRVLGMTGSGHFPVADVAQISVGRETWNGARVALLPDDMPAATQIDGILGVDFLSQYAALYSQQERVIRLYPKELIQERSYQGWSSIPLFDMKVGEGDVTMLAFDMFIDGAQIPTMFDLGASVNLMNRKAARLLNIRPRKPRGNADVRGAFGEAVAAAELVAWRLKVGNELWHRKTFMIGDFPVFYALDLDDKPAALAGTGLFGQREFIIDFVRKRLLVRGRD